MNFTHLRTILLKKKYKCNFYSELNNLLLSAWKRDSTIEKQPPL